MTETVLWLLLCFFVAMLLMIEVVKTDCFNKVENIESGEWIAIFALSIIFPVGILIGVVYMLYLLWPHLVKSRSLRFWR